MFAATTSRNDNPHGLLAQLVEHIVHIDGVTGSSPVQTTPSQQWEGFFVLGNLFAFFPIFQCFVFSFQFFL